MRIEVTEKHIENGKTMSDTKCPVALAIQDLIPNRNVRVGARWIRIDGQWIQSPSHVCNFVREFDDHKDVYPFSFELDL